MASLNVVLRDDLKADDKDEYHVMLRLYHKKITYPYTFDFKVMKRFWNSDTQRVKRTKIYENYGKWNSEIIDVYNKAQEVVERQLEKNPDISAKNLRNIIASKLTDDKVNDPSTCFFCYAEQLINEYRQNGQISTAKKYERMIKRIKKHTGSENLSYTEITEEFLNDFFHWLEYEKPNKRTGKKGLSRNTCHLTYTLFKSVFNRALEKFRHLEKRDPFFRINSEQELNSITPLTKDQLEQIKNVSAEKGTNLFHTKNMFLFAIYAGGIRFSDVCKLKWKDIKTDNNGRYLDLKTQKTDSSVKVPILSYAEKILNLYDSKIKQVDSYVFPFGNRKNLDRNDPEEYFKFRTSVNTNLNAYLKKITKKADIDKELNYHLSKHTYANLLYEAGFTIEEIREALSHSDKRTTLRYIRRIVEFDTRDKRDRYEKALSSS